MPTGDERQGTQHVSTAEEIAERTRSRLPAATVAGIRAAYLDEITDRLPRLREAARTLDPALMDDALRDVHTLGSGGFLAGENEAAHAARAAEASLKAGEPLELFAAHVHELDRLLTGWTP